MKIWHKIKKIKQHLFPIREDEDYIHSFFGLTYASYLVIPRSILQSMPTKWQRDFVKLLEELDEICAKYGVQTPDYSVSAKENGKFTTDFYRYYYRNGYRCRGLRDIFEEVSKKNKTS